MLFVHLLFACKLFSCHLQMLPKWEIETTAFKNIHCIMIEKYLRDGKITNKNLEKEMMNGNLLNRRWEEHKKYLER